MPERPTTKSRFTVTTKTAKQAQEIGGELQGSTTKSGKASAGQKTNTRRTTDL